MPRENSGKQAWPAHLVEFDSDDLIGKCVTALNRHLKVAALRYVVQRGAAPGRPRAGFTTVELSTHAGTVGTGPRPRTT